MPINQQELAELEKQIDSMDFSQFARFNKSKAKVQTDFEIHTWFAVIDETLKDDKSAQFHLKAKALSKVSDFWHDCGYDGPLEKDRYFQLGMRELIENYGKATDTTSAFTTPAFPAVKLKQTKEQQKEIAWFNKEISDWRDTSKYPTQASVERNYSIRTNIIKDSKSLRDDQKYYLLQQALLVRNEASKALGKPDAELTKQLSDGFSNLIKHYRDVPKASFSVSESFPGKQPAREAPPPTPSAPPPTNPYAPPPRSTGTGTYARMGQTMPVNKELKEEKKQLLARMAEARSRGKNDLKRKDAEELVTYSSNRSYKEMFADAIKASRVDAEESAKTPRR